MTLSNFFGERQPKIMNHSYQIYGFFSVVQIDKNDKNLRWTLSETILVLSGYRIKMFKNRFEKKRFINLGKDRGQGHTPVVRQQLNATFFGKVNMDGFEKADGLLPLKDSLQKQEYKR